MDTLHDAAPRRAAGFTLIELLVVITILGVLAVALLPAISNALGRGDDAETQARMLELQAAIDQFEGKFGFYPPDDFQNNEAAQVQVQAKTDKVNAGIESCLMFLCFGEVDISGNEDWFANTDGDMNSVAIPLLDRKDKVEIVDAWGTPLAYIHNRSYTQKHEIMFDERGGGDSVEVVAMRNPNSSGYLASRSYQILSAGGDLEFGTDDDLTIPARPVE